MKGRTDCRIGVGDECRELEGVVMGKRVRRVDAQEWNGGRGVGYGNELVLIQQRSA